MTVAYLLLLVFHSTVLLLAFDGATDTNILIFLPAATFLEIALRFILLTFTVETVGSFDPDGFDESVGSDGFVGFDGSAGFVGFVGSSGIAATVIVASVAPSQLYPLLSALASGSRSFTLRTYVTSFFSVFSGIVSEKVTPAFFTSPSTYV